VRRRKRTPTDAIREIERHQAIGDVHERRSGAAWDAATQQWRVVDEPNPANADAEADDDEP
jgi:hypothetical protein